MRFALFAEGTVGSEVDPKGKDYFVDLWTRALVAALGLGRQPHVIFGISKKHLLAMDPKMPPMSGAAEPLDQFIARKLNQFNFDAAIVAWDLQPVWNGGASRGCRWQETLALYEGLAISKNLPQVWIDNAKQRLAELKARAVPSDRRHPAKLAQGAVIGVCMEPVFEGLISSNEKILSQILGCHGKRVPDWPKWNSATQHPEREHLGPAIQAAKAMQPRIKAAHAVRGDLITAKHAWACRLVDGMASTPAGSAALRNHPIGSRLRDLL